MLHGLWMVALTWKSLRNLGGPTTTNSVGLLTRETEMASALIRLFTASTT